MANKLYFKDGAVQITDVYAIFGSRRFPIADISSIQEVMKTRPSPMNNIAWIGVMILVLGALLLTGTFFTVQLKDFAYQGLSMFIGLIGLLILVLQVSRPRVYRVLKIKGTFGTEDVAITDEPGYAHKVVKAVNTARKAQAVTPIQAPLDVV